MVYLFAGQDNFSKDLKLKKIKEEFLSEVLKDFNSDVLYAKDASLLILQEKLLYFPLKLKKRILVIKEAGGLKKEIQEFIIKYIKKPDPGIILVLDFQHYDPKDEFINSLARYSQLVRFKESIPLSTFTLSRQIQLQRTDEALRVLNELLKNGEKPERILGGLRYAAEKYAFSPHEGRKRLEILLNCDIEIKTGRLRPDFALEKLVISLCNLKQPAH